MEERVPLGDRDRDQVKCRGERQKRRRKLFEGFHRREVLDLGRAGDRSRSAQDLSPLQLTPGGRMCREG